MIAGAFASKVASPLVVQPAATCTNGAASVPVDLTIESLTQAMVEFERMRDSVYPLYIVQPQMLVPWSRDGRAFGLVWLSKRSLRSA